MAPWCFSGLWCFGWLPPSPSDDETSSPVFTGTTRLSNGGVRDAAETETTQQRSRPSVPGNGAIPTRACPTQDSQLGTTDFHTPASTEQPTGLHSLESNVDVPVPVEAKGVPSMSPSSRRTYRLDPAKAKEHIDRIPRFRILVMGRANAGKTTILQRVCNTADQPEIFNGKGKKLDATVVQGSLKRGRHDIEDELVFRSNPRFVFHDSCGFEAGGEEQFDLMKKFVMDRARSTKLNDRIHAIWFCIPLTDSHRMVTACERKFFDECDTGCVPVILLATKADALELEAFEELENDESAVDDVVRCGELAKEILKNHMERVKEWLGKTRFPPHDYLPLAGMEQQGAVCTSLLTCTANALKEEGLQQLLISTQQSNLELCMDFAIMKTLKKCMSKHIDSIWLGTLAFFLALWFPYKHCPEFLQGGYQGLPLQFHEPEGHQEHFRELFQEEFEYYYGEFEEGSFYLGVGGVMAGGAVC